MSTLANSSKFLQTAPDGLFGELRIKIKFLLKQEGMTIKGVKKILNNNDSLKLDEVSNKSIKANNLVIN